jgi:AhpD family alkylhydroperoxidase
MASIRPCSVELRAAQINHCAFCLDMHSKGATVACESAERNIQLNAWTESKHFYTANESGSVSTVRSLCRVTAACAARRHPCPALRCRGRRAVNEVRATGLTGPRRTGSEVSPLTTQQREIAEFATSGLTNKQIGERVFVSHRPSPGTCRKFTRA